MCACALLIYCLLLRKQALALALRRPSVHDSREVLGLQVFHQDMVRALLTFRNMLPVDEKGFPDSRATRITKES